MRHVREYQGRRGDGVVDEKLWMRSCPRSLLLTAFDLPLDCDGAAKLFPLKERYGWRGRYEDEWSRDVAQMKKSEDPREMGPLL